MTEQIVIGNCDIGITTIKIDNYSKLSENSAGYRVFDILGDITLIVCKKTEEGKKITQMINDNKSEEKILDYLKTITLKQMDPQDILTLITNEIKSKYDKGFDEGVLFIKNKFKELLF